MLDVGFLKEIPSFAMALPERADAITKELGLVGIVPTIVPAIDMREKPLPTHWQRQASDLGASLTWLRVLDIVSQSTADMVAVFEDDFYFRLDTLSEIPSAASVNALDFDSIYLTGHYDKGATRVAPRRVQAPYTPGIVRAFGIFTLPARILRPRFAGILRDAIKTSMDEHGIGADSVDAILQIERKRTYALEAHIGGQRRADRRSWEPRVIDAEVIFGSHRVKDFPAFKDALSEDEVRALIAYASRFPQVIILNGSTQTVGAVAEAVTPYGGRVQALNLQATHDKLVGRSCDRLKRYIGYGALDLGILDDIGRQVRTKNSFKTLIVIDTADHEAKKTVEQVQRLIVSRTDQLNFDLFFCGPSSNEFAKTTVAACETPRRLVRIYGANPKGEFITILQHA